MDRRNKHILIKLLLIVGICLSGCLNLNHKVGIDYIELYSHDYNSRTRCTWPQDLITINREISDYLILNDALLLRRIDSVIDELPRHARKDRCINARIVCIVHRDAEVDTLSFGWEATEFNSIGYSTLDTGMIRFIGHYLSKAHQESLDYYLKRYVDRIKRFGQ